MSKSVDLHIHSTFSEGNLTPKQIVLRAKKHNIGAISITDHDVLDGNKEALYWGQKLGINVIPGVEIYADYRKWDIHLLGYGINLSNKPLNYLLKDLQEKHFADVEKSVTKLQKLGFEIDFKQVVNSLSKYIGLGQIVTALSLNKKNLQKFKKDIKKPDPTFFDIIKQYFTKGKRAHLPEASTGFKKVLKAIKSAGGIPVLAHPGQQLTREDDEVIKSLKKEGIRGLEVITPYHNWHQIEHYQQIALDLKLLITGGTDLHASQVYPLGPIKNQWSYFKVPYEIYNNLKKNLR